MNSNTNAFEGDSCRDQYKSWNPGLFRG